MIQEAIVLITSSDQKNKTFGTGFVIYKTANTCYVVTCAHVIDDIGGINKALIENIPAEVIAIGESSGADIAVLSVTANLRKEPLVMQFKAESGVQFATAGFCNYGKRLLTRTLRGELGLSVGLAYQGYNERIKAWDILITDEYHLQKGYSGSPVVEEDSGCVIGLISDRHDDGKRGLAISIDTLPLIWREVPSEVSDIFAQKPAPLHLSKLYPPAGKQLVETSENIEVLTNNLVEEVCRIYKLLGAETKSIQVKEFDIPVFAEFRRGAITFSLIAECKFCRPQQRVTKEDIQVFLLKFTSARENAVADKGVYITTTSYDRESRRLGDQYGIQCLTLEELYNQLVDFRGYTRSTIDEFANSELGLWYIEQTASDLEDYDSLIENNIKEFLHYTTVEYIDYLFFSQHKRRIALLGNFGTGKTSFCIKYRDILLRRYLNNRSQRIPILVNLRDYRSGIDIHQVITNYLQKLPGIQIDMNLCLELQRMGRFFFLLDGLDEMATKVDQVVVNENLREIDRLFTENNNIYLLTCRTHFFQERISDDILRDYSVIYLVEWGQSELEIYLQKRFPQKWGELLKRINHTPNLQELARTPLLLDMIVKSLSELEITSDGQINSSYLYKTYVDEWIVRQSKRRGAIMSIPQRQHFAESLAAKLYVENRTHLHFSELYEVAREFSGHGDPTRLDYFDTDARTCTFVTKDSQGYYGFRHRSFMEYFCSCAMEKEINSGNPMIFSKRPLTKELLHFLSNMNFLSQGFSSLREWSAKFPEKTLSMNAVKLLLACGEKLTEDVEKHYQIDGTLWSLLRRAIVFDDDKAMDEFLVESDSVLKRTVIRQSSIMQLDSYTVEELVSEVRLKIWSLKDKKTFADNLENLPDFSLRSYVTKLCQSTFMDLERVSLRGGITFVAEEELDSQKDIVLRGVEDEVIQKETLNEAIKALPETTRYAFISLYYDGLSLSQIAENLGISEQSVNMMLRRATSTIRKKYNIGKYDEDA